MKKLLMALAVAVTTVVTQTALAVDLPANYTQLKWVEATGQQAVITDYTPMNTDSIEMKVMFMNSAGCAIFDAREPAAQHRYTFLKLDDGQLRMDWNSGAISTTGTPLTPRKLYEIFADFANCQVFLDGAKRDFSWSPGGITEEKLKKPLRLFAAQTMNGNDGDLSLFASMRLYSFTVRDKAGVVKLDLIPCQTNAGKVGLWDSVSGDFLESNSADHPLVAGPSAKVVSVTLTAYAAETGVASLAFSGVDREMQLIARAGDEAKVVATVASGTTALDVAVPQFEGAAPGAVRFVLIDFVPVTEVKGFGSHAINTGIVPDATTTVRFKAALDSSDSYANRTEFGVAGAYFAFVQKAGTASGPLYWNFFGTTQESGVQSASYRNGKMHTFEFGPGGYFVDGTKKAGPFTPGTATTDKPIILCGRNPTYGTTSTDWKLDCCTFAWAEIEKGGKLVRCFQPCLKDGVGQFYDTCSGQFYANAPSLCSSCIYGFFSAGPLDIEAIDDFASGVSAPVAELLPAAEIRTVTVTSYEAATGAAELAFSAGKEKKLLYVAKGDCDRGPDAAKWGAFAFLGEVGPSVTSGGYTVPAALRGQGALRFFLTRYLPPDQRPVEVCEYVESRGEAYVEVTTGYVPKNTDKVRMKVSVSDAGVNHALFEARNLNASKRVGMMALLDTSKQSQLRFRIDRGSSCEWATTPDVVQSEKVYDVYSDFAVCALSVDGEQVLNYSGRGDMNVAEESIPVTMLIFASRAINTGVPQAFAQAKLRSFSITNRMGTCELELVPCVNNGVGALYDRVTGTYLKSATTTPLVAGGVGIASELRDAESSSEPVRGGDISFKVNASDWKVTVTVGEGTTGGRLFVATAKEDCGESVNDWPHVAEIGEVSAENRTLTASLPEEWKSLKMKSYRVFLACTEPHCPYDSLLSALTSSGSNSDGQYIDTGIVPDGTTKIELEVSRGDVDQAEFGIAGAFYMFDNRTDTHYGFLNDASAGSKNVCYHDNKPHTLVLGPDGGYIDDTTVVEGPLVATKTTDLTVTLFARRTDATTVAKRSTATITYAKMWQGGKLVRDFVPCVKDGVGYLYDRVGGEFYDNKGTGSFRLGTPRGGAVFESEIIGVSDVKRACLGLFIVVK